MSTVDSSTGPGAAAAAWMSPPSGSRTTARPLVAAASCSARAWAASSRLAADERRRLAASSAVIAEARRAVARAWSRTRPVSHPVVMATAKNTAKVRTSAGCPIQIVRRGVRKKKL